MCPDTVDLPPLSAAPGILLLQIRHIEPRPEANGQQPRPLVAVRPPLAHPPHGKPGLHARTDEFGDRMRTGVDHNRLAGGLVLEMCLRAAKLPGRV